MKHRSSVVVGNQVFRFVQAQEPDEEEEEEILDEEVTPPVLDETGAEMVKQLREGPAENWRKFLQPIIISIRNQYGLEVGRVSLVGPRIKSKFTTPRYGFFIQGHVKFTPEVPDEVVTNHGTPPYAFEAYITPEGELVSSVNLIGSEG